MIHWVEEKNFILGYISNKPYAKIEDNGKKISLELLMIKFPFMNSKKTSIKYTNNTEREMAISIAKNHTNIAIDEYTMFINSEYKILNSR
jgi:hypothetical protein